MNSMIVRTNKFGDCGSLVSRTARDRVLPDRVLKYGFEPLNYYRYPARYCSPGIRDMTDNNRPGVCDPCD